MRVVEIATTCNPQQVIAEYVAAYGKDHGLTPARVAEWVALLGGMVGVRTGMRVVIRMVKQIGSGERLNYDVSGCKATTPEDIAEYAKAGMPPPQGETMWALDFTDWQEWREMPVEDRTGKQLSNDQLAAHLLYEMSWHGWPSSMEAKRDQLHDAKDSFDRAFADYKPGDPLPPGYSTLEDLLKRVKKDEEGSEPGAE